MLYLCFFLKQVVLLKILGLGTQARILINNMQDSPATNPNSEFCSSQTLIHATFSLQAENCYCKIIFSSSLLFHAIQYVPTSGFIFSFVCFKISQKKPAFLSLSKVFWFSLSYYMHERCGWQHRWIVAL